MLEKIKKMMGKDELRSPKGMHDIRGEEYYNYQGMFEKAQEVAVYYGFKPIETPILEYASIFTTSIGEGTDMVDKEMYTLKSKGGEHLALRPEGTAGVMRSYIEHGYQSEPQPLLFYYYGPYFRHENPQRGRLREFRQFGLEIIGTEKSIADAIVIRTMVTILHEFGFKDLVVEINSIGDKETRNAYIHDLTNYYKKHVNSLCKNCEERLKNNPLRLLDCKELSCAPFKERAPSTLNSLNSSAKEHFKQVLEYLEEMEVPYRINNTLVRGISYYTRTVFEIIYSETNEDGSQREIALTGGGRYNNLAKTLGAKKDAPGVGVGLGFERLMLYPERKKLSPRIIKKPKVYFIQLGFDAKVKSLPIIEILRRAKIPVFQSLSKDSLTAQLAQAEQSGVPYVIIFGQKEAIEKTVIVRDMLSHSQENVPISALPEYVKDLRSSSGQ